MPAGQAEPRWQLHAGLAPCAMPAAAVPADSAGVAAADAIGCDAEQHDWTAHLQSIAVMNCTAGIKMPPTCLFTDS